MKYLYKINNICIKFNMEPVPKMGRWLKRVKKGISLRLRDRNKQTNQHIVIECSCDVLVNYKDVEHVFINNHN